MLKKTKSYISNFFNKGHERSVLAKKNIAASFLIKGCSIAISLALVPMTIDYVNPTQYGIWLTLSSIVAWFSFFDMGFGNGMRNRFAEAKAKGQTEKARIYVSTTYAVLALIFGAVWILFFVANFFIDWSVVLNAPAELAEELSKLALIVFSFFCMQIVLKTINTVLIADQKPAKSSFFDMLGQLIALMIIIILTKTTSGSLLYLGLALGFAPVAIMIVSSILFYSRTYKKVAPSLKFIRFSIIKDIIGLGLKFFIIQVSAVVIFQTTNIVIAQTQGAENVTVYNIAYKYFSVLIMVFMIIVTPFWSAFTDAYAKKEYEWMKNVIKKLKTIWIYLIPAAIIMTLISNRFYLIWVGSDVEISFLISALMAVYLIFFTRFNMFILLINGTGKVQLQLYINVVICILYVPLAIIAATYFEIAGVIVINIFVAVIHSIVSEIQISKIVNNTGSGIWIK